MHEGRTQLLSLQMRLWQSVSAAQLRPNSQAEHVAPPQSISLSVPLLRPSLQVGAGLESGAELIEAEPHAAENNIQDSDSTLMCRINSPPENYAF